ncbi:MAG: hypothetical protein AAF840_18945 [Bacteroidota bacterium]
MTPKSRPKHDTSHLDRGASLPPLDLPKDEPKSSPPELPPGIYITYESILVLFIAACLITGAVVLVIALTEAFYRAKAWIAEHHAGFLFALCVIAAVPLLAKLIRPYYQNWRQDDPFV